MTGIKRRNVLGAICAFFAGMSPWAVSKVAKAAKECGKTSSWELSDTLKSVRYQYDPKTGMRTTTFTLDEKPVVVVVQYDKVIVWAQLMKEHAQADTLPFGATRSVWSVYFRSSFDMPLDVPGKTFWTDEGHLNAENDNIVQFVTNLATRRKEASEVQ